MKSLPLYAIAFSFCISIATTIFYIGSLHQNLTILANDDRIRIGQMRDFSLDLSPNRNQVALNFTNNFFHITSDEEWAPLSRPQVFRVDPDSPREYVTSMDQQLGCLDAIRKAYLSYHLAQPKLTSALYRDAEICLEQLRQNVMCNGDLTLEPTILVRETDGTIIPGSSGSGVIHRCRDWQKLQTTKRDSGGEFI